jgi:hypothetical protein
MKRRTAVSCFAVALALVVLVLVGPTPLGGLLRSGLAKLLAAPDTSPPIRDLNSLLLYPYDVQIVELTGPEREGVVATLLARPEAAALQAALAQKGFVASAAEAQALRVSIESYPGDPTPGDPFIIDVVVAPASARQVFLPLVLRGYSSPPAGGTAAPASADRSTAGGPPVPSPYGTVAYLVAMVAEDGTSFFQAHHTNLDPNLAEVPDPVIWVNGMQYFYVTTLHWMGPVDGAIMPWHYWWYNSNHHPNWYYSYYRFYYGYYVDWSYPWPGWYHWAYGWTYWRFWYYWSSYFPWAAPAPWVAPLP